MNSIADSAAIKKDGDILLISPPFASIDRPSIGLGLIQQIAEKEGLTCEILYANMSLAAQLGAVEYSEIAESSPLQLIGERLFSRFVFPQMKSIKDTVARGKNALVSEKYCAVEQEISLWLESFRAYIKTTDFRIYGFSTMFAQNLASAVLIKIIRTEKPEALLIIGGANCDGEMASGIANLAPELDYIFSGEADLSFQEFCKKFTNSEPPENKIIYGGVNSEWKSSPAPDYSSFLRQREFFFSDELSDSAFFIPYETSRGCWWGQKNHCTFCGLNGTGMEFREKDPELVYRELMSIHTLYPDACIAMTDNIMPLSYFKSLLPRLGQAEIKPSIFYEQKSNLKKHQLRALKEAGISSIQPGIESLSTRVLKLMKKGVSAAQNISVLRDCRSFSIDVSWNLLYGFPGELAEDYLNSIQMLPMLVHLSAPNSFSPVVFDRFSPYFDNPDSFGIANLRPYSSYQEIYPSDYPHISSLAYHFEGDSKGLVEDSPTTFEELKAAAEVWMEAWRCEVRPILCVVESDHKYFVLDTRVAQTPAVDFVEFATAIALTSTSRHLTPGAEIGLEKNWIIEVDGLFVGLASTISDTLLSFKGDPHAEAKYEIENIRIAVQGA